MPRSSVEAWKDVRENPRRGGPFPRGAVMSAKELSVGAEYEFMAEAERGRWNRLAVRAFAGFVEAGAQDDSILDTSTGVRLEFTCQQDPWLPRRGEVIQFWDGGAKDGWLKACQVIGDDATIAVVPVTAGGGTKRRTDDNLRRVFG